MPSWTQMREFVPATMTTAERDAAWESPPNYLTIFNSTIGMYQVYAGVRWVSLAQYVTVAESSAPGVGDDSDDFYVIGDRWIDTTNDKEYVCVDVTVGAAVWLDLYHPENHIHARVITFSFPDEELSAAVFLPRPSWMLLDKLPTPTAEANQRFTVTAGTAGTGTNTIVLESSTDRSAWTIQATVSLDTAIEDEIDGVFTSDWVWDPATEYLRVRCTAVGGTAPKDVTAVFDYD